uniref:Uncharacterized protein n=1 Tax=Cacopsylla melanoneura TaxID=428564 RepID=A0A8D8XSF0_9HEMI
MFIRVFQLLVPTVFYLITTQCELFNNKPKGPIPWKDVNMTANEWEGIQSLIGKDPCAENMKYCMELAKIIKTREHARALRKCCETDKSITNQTVCWIRQKTNLDVGKRTTFEAQFWTESPTVSRLRYAIPDVDA